MIGRGKFGIVFETERHKAVKKVSNNDSSHREINNLRKLGHNDYTIIYIDSFVDCRNVYIITNYLTGPRLDEVPYNLMPLPQKKDTLYYLLYGLQYIHCHDIIHRDIKLSNLMFDVGKPKYIDFGSSCETTDISCQLIQIGTMAYISPELLARKTSIERSHESSYNQDITNMLLKSDIWSLGIVCYHLLYDRHPFNTDSMAQLFEEINSYNPKFDPSYHELSDIVKSMLIKDYQKRPTIQQIINQLIPSSYQPQNIVPQIPVRTNSYEQYENSDEETFEILR